MDLKEAVILILMCVILGGIAVFVAYRNRDNDPTSKP
jgi:hypothetical protein